MGGVVRRAVIGVSSVAMFAALLGMAPSAGAVAGPADLIVTARAPATAFSGVPYAHAYTVTNQGGAVASAGRLRVHVNGRSTGPHPTQVLLVPPGCIVTEPEIFGDTYMVCELGDLAPGESVSRRLLVVVGSAGTYSHDANVSTASPESDVLNNFVSSYAVVATGSPQLDGTLVPVLALVSQLLAAVGL